MVLVIQFVKLSEEDAILHERVRGAAVAEASVQLLDALGGA